MAVKTPEPTHALSQEVREKLRQPIPQQYLRTVDKGQRGSYVYADVDYLESRLEEVDPDYQLDYKVDGDVMICAIKLLGVLRSSTAGIEAPRDRAERHTQVTKAEAAAFRRACAKFGLGAELWAKEVQTTAAKVSAYTPSYEKPRSAAGRREASDAQRKFAKNLGLTDGEVDQLNWNGTREAPGEGGQILDILKNARNRNSAKYNENPRRWVYDAIQRVAPHLVWDGGSDNNEETEYDEDE